MAVDEDQQRARWKRNKQDERARKSPYPHALTTHFKERILQERDRRASAALGFDLVIRVGHFFYEPGTYERAIRFAADVWAADTWLKEEWGPKGAMPRRVAAWLQEYGARHGYSEKSLPKMIKKARWRIELLEQPLDWNFGRPVWAAFEPHE